MGLTDVSIKQVVKPCSMEMCEYNREIELNTSRWNNRRSMDAMDTMSRRLIEGRCAYCRFFERFDLLVKKEAPDTWHR